LFQPMFPMTDVHAVAIDTSGSSPRVFAAITNEHFGPTVVTSDDLGVTWDEPDHAPIAFAEETGAALAGCGRSCRSSRSSTRASSRRRCSGRPTAAGRSSWCGPLGAPASRKVDVRWRRDDDPHDPPAPDGRPEGDRRDVHRRGVPHRGRREELECRQPRREGGLPALPIPGVRTVHKVAMNPEPERYFLQNHGGVYRSDDDTATWTSIADGLPGDFGFAMLAHPHRPDVIYNFPLVADVLVPAGRPVPRTAARTRARRGRA
jgi:hypothetical protein